MKHKKTEKTFAMKCVRIKRLSEDCLDFFLEGVREATTFQSETFTAHRRVAVFHAQTTDGVFLEELEKSGLDQVRPGQCFNGDNQDPGLQPSAPQRGVGGMRR